MEKERKENEKKEKEMKKEKEKEKKGKNKDAAQAHLVAAAPVPSRVAGSSSNPSTTESTPDRQLSDESLLPSPPASELQRQKYIPRRNAVILHHRVPSDDPVFIAWRRQLEQNSSSPTATPNDTATEPVGIKQ